MTARHSACALAIAIALSALFATELCQAQADSGVDDIARLRYDFQRRVSNRSRFFTVVSYEQYVESGDVLGARPELTLKAGFSYNAKEWLRLEAGAGTYYTWRDTANDLFELRLWQAATFDWPEIRALARWVVHHRFMLEERFKYSDDWDTSLRGRYRLSFTVPINTYTIEPGSWYLPLEGEIFWNPEDSASELFTNKAQVTAGLGLQVNKAWAVELRYMWQESRDTIGADFDQDDNIIELRIKSTIRIVDYLKSR